MSTEKGLKDNLIELHLYQVLRLPQLTNQSLAAKAINPQKSQIIDKKANENKTEPEIEQKFTPLLPKIPLFSRVAPNKESIILPKNPKKAAIYRKSTSKIE